MNRVIVGKNLAGTYIYQVSEAGIDVLTATPDQLIIDSNFMQFGQYLHGSVSIVGSRPYFDTYTIVTFPSLGYIPLAACFKMQSATAAVTPQFCSNSFDNTDGSTFLDLTDKNSIVTWETTETTLKIGGYQAGTIGYSIFYGRTL